MNNDKPTFVMNVEDNRIDLVLAGKITDAYKDEFKKWADDVHAKVLELSGKTEQKVKFLTDLSGLESVGPEAILILDNLLMQNAPHVHKSATFGAHGLIMAMLSTSSVRTNRPNFQHFPTREKAVAWLIE